MALVFSDDIWDRWRLPALALAAAAIIVVPWLTLRKLQQDSEEAMALGIHSMTSLLRADGQLVPVERRVAPFSLAANGAALLVTMIRFFSLSISGRG